MTEFPFDCYQALRARDPRFDGRFFVGVKTTGIYCRPVCAARTPRAASCVFLATAAAAERAGFRPCLRCRPELALGGAGGPPLAEALFAAIRGRVAHGDSVRELAGPTGYSPRQLRRLTMQSFGVTPVEILPTERLLFAKKLLHETPLPIRDLAAGAARGELDFRPGTGMEEAVQTLRRVRGIGEWTAQYVAMRALRHPDAFPAADLGLRKALAPAGETLAGEKEIIARSAPWRPWRAYAVLHLWQGLEK